MASTASTNKKNYVNAGNCPADIRKLIGDLYHRREGVQTHYDVEDRKGVKRSVAVEWLSIKQIAQIVEKECGRPIADKAVTAIAEGGLGTPITKLENCPTEVLKDLISIHGQHHDAKPTYEVPRRGYKETVALGKMTNSDIAQVIKAENKRQMSHVSVSKILKRRRTCDR